jgi:hypothetical protein
MRYFIDTEFNAPGTGNPIDLISIGVVAEDGREFYACNRAFKTRRATPWVRENVLPLLPDPNPGSVQWGGSPRLNSEALAWMSYGTIRTKFLAFIGDDPDPEFWGYYCAYDYVILSQLMGGMDAWPDGWPYLMLDLRQWLDYEALHHVSQPDDAPHDALQDARWIRDTFLEYHRDK